MKRRVSDEYLYSKSLKSERCIFQSRKTRHYKCKVITYNDDVEVRHQVIRKHSHQHFIFTHSLKPVTLLLQTRIILRLVLLLWYMLLWRQRAVVVALATASKLHLTHQLTLSNSFQCMFNLHIHRQQYGLKQQDLTSQCKVLLV